MLDPIGKLQGLPMPRQELIKKALEKRPDLLAWKYGLRRAEADLKLAKANGYPDVFVLYQPYTFQNNTYLGVPSAYSWTLGVTASIPLYNRNQGNVTRAKINIHQSEHPGRQRRARGRERRLERRSGARAEQGRRRAVPGRDPAAGQESAGHGLQAHARGRDQHGRLSRRPAGLQRVRASVSRCADSAPHRRSST